MSFNPAVKRTCASYAGWSAYLERYVAGEIMADMPLSKDDLQAIVRSISKNGDFFLAQDELAAASRLLSQEQSVHLYEYIRDNADRIEAEWRNEFVDAFPGIENSLPNPLW